MRKQQRQAGFLLAELSVAMSIIMIAFTAYLVFWASEVKRGLARSTGVRIAQYNSAVASWLNDHDPATNPVPPGNYAGLGWLQDAATCPGGTAARSYIPCGADPFLPFNLAYNTTVAPAGGFFRAVTNLGPAVTGLGVDRVAGGEIVAAAGAFAGSYTMGLERTQGYTRYDIDIPTGNITAVVDASVLAGPYLRHDGSNQMTGDLNMGGRHVNNAANVNAAGTVRGGNVAATNNVTAGRDMNAGRNVTANNANAGGNVQIANSDVNLAESAQAPKYVTHGGYVDKPVCPPDKPAARLFGQVARFYSGDAADPVTAVNPTFDDQGGRWQIFVTGYTLKHPGGIQGNAYTAVLVTTTCGN